MKPIVFYDGECGLCNYWVQWILERDVDRIFQFAPLQSSFAGELFNFFDRELTTRSLIVMKDKDTFLEKYEAVAYLLSRLSPGSFAHHLLRATPRFLGDFGYDGVAAFRRVTRRGSCRLFSPAEKAAFLNGTPYLDWARENNFTK